MFFGPLLLDGLHLRATHDGELLFGDVHAVVLVAVNGCLTGDERPVVQSGDGLKLEALSLSPCSSCTCVICGYRTR